MDELQPGLPPPPPRLQPPAPLLPVAIGMILGIAADERFAAPGWTSAIVVLAGAGLWLAARGRISLGFFAVVVSAAGVGALRHAVADRWLADDHVVFFTSREPMLTTLEGRVISTPYVIEPQPNVPRAYSIGPKTQFVIEVAQLAGRDGPIRVSGKVAVSIKAPVLSLDVGDVVEMTGWVYRPRGPQNPGDYDWALHKRRNGLLVGMSCDHAESVVVRQRRVGGAWTRFLDGTRDRLRGYLLDSAFERDDPGAGVISAMVLAQRSDVPQAMNQAFIRTGNAHFLAASGMNVGWLAVTGWMIMRLLGVYYRTTAALVGFLILSYVLLAEPQPSILRAGIMGLLGCLTICLRGRANILNWLACSAVIVLLIDPADCFRPAFQYSFLAVLALMYFCPRLSATIAGMIGKTRWPQLGWLFHTKEYYLSLMNQEREPTNLSGSLARRISFWAMQLFLLSLSAWLVTAPLCCYEFNQFTPWGPVNTFLLWFIAAPVTCWGYIALLLALLFPSSQAICGPVLKAGTNLMVVVVEHLARIPGTILDGRSPSIWWVFAVYAVMGAWLYRPAWLRPRWAFKLLVASLAIWWLIPPRWMRQEKSALQLWVLAVGDGMAGVAELPDGRVLLCDFGTRSPFDAGRVGVSFLKHRGITKVEAAFVSHADFDHLSGIETIAREIPIRRIVINDHFGGSAVEGTAPRRFLQAMREIGVSVEVFNGPRQFEGGGGVSIEAIWPPSVADLPKLDANNASTVLRIGYEGRFIILPGDIRELAMGRLLSDARIKADVLVLPHHGSVVSNTGRFIAAADPRVVVRSAGQREMMTTTGLDRLVAGRLYFNTAEAGCVRLRIKNGELSADAVAGD